MDVRISPRRLRGTITPPPSKSMAHRLLIAAALGEGISIVQNMAFSEDIEATLRCITALGGQWETQEGNTVRVTGIGHMPYAGELPVLDCGESGSTLRFFLPIALTIAGGGVFTGRGRLMERPQTPYWDLFDARGITHDLKDGVLTVRGRLRPGEYRLPGDISSQFFTGLLFALSRLEGESRIESTTALESADYVTMTIQAMRQAGVCVRASGNARFTVRGQPYQSFGTAVEADWSQAAFWYAANALGSEIDIQGLNPESAQGDRVIDVLARRMCQSGELEIDLSGCPDLLPPLAVIAAHRKGVTRFVNAGRLRLKESDRLATVAEMLCGFGIRVKEEPERLIIGGSLPIPLNLPAVSNRAGRTVDGCNDHRIVMAAAILISAWHFPTVIHGAEAVNKSYPDFFEHYQQLGGEIDVL